MLSVNTNDAASKGIQALSAAAAAMDGIRTRLSTGKKVSSAKDDGATWAIAQNIRSDLSSRLAVGTSLDRAASVLDIARSGAEQIADLIIDIRAKGAALADTALDAPSQAALRSDIASLVKQVDFIANAAEFGGVNLLVPKTDPTVTVAGASGGYTPTLNVSAAIDGRASFVQFNYQFYNTTPTPAPLVTIGGTNNDGVYWHQVSGLTNQTSGWYIATRYGDWRNYDDQAPSNVTFQANTSPFVGVPGAYGAELLSITQTTFRSHEYAVDAPSGSGFEMTYRPMTAQWLGLSGLDTASPDTILAMTDAALAQTTFNASALGSEQKAADMERALNAKMADTLSAAVGNLVDADLAKESAALQAAQARQALSIQALGLANAMPRSMLQLFAN